MEEKSRRLTEFILTQIRGRGPVPFHDFMGWCLYHPEYGYYQSPETGSGPSGDYYTSPCVHPLFGGLIARQLLQMAHLLGDERFEIIEMGGGKGYLCEDILTWIRRNEPDFYEGVHYSLIEHAPLCVSEQKNRLAPFEKEGKVSWMDSRQFGSTEAPWRFKGCFLSNELIDAFPVHRVIVHQGVLKEIYVREEAGEFREHWGELTDPGILPYFESLGITLEEGQTAEVNLEALRWLETVARRLDRGFVLTIDYGHLARELYAPHRRGGTLLCYFRHLVSENPYERIGEQDITSHVNFTALIRRGQELGLQTTGFVPQFHFLIGLGLLEEMESIGRGMTPLEALKLRLSIKHLIEPETGMGEAFKVLIQHRGTDQLLLDGLRDLDTIPWPN
jgi:SAM-dependent MidA family methyltransferase